MSCFISTLFCMRDAFKRDKNTAYNNPPFIKSAKKILLTLTILFLSIASLSLLATPQPEQQLEPVTNSALSKPTDKSSANSSAGNKTEIHHPRGNLEGSYSLNTPARPGFWVATGFTALVIASLITTLVVFRPNKPR